MTLDELIRHAGEGELKVPLTADMMAHAAESLSMSRAELCDRFARRVGEAFLAGGLPWDIGDVAINKLIGFCATKCDAEMSSLIWDVHIAFDQAEYRHPCDPADFDRTTRTRGLLEKALRDQAP